jgi:AcrR family transcriptional regulator
MSTIEQKKKTGPKPKPKSADRRVLRTCRMIKQALADLMHTKRYEDITVQDIIDRADVGRSTFYAHYTDKEQAAQDILEEMMDSITREVKTEEGKETSIFPIAGLFRSLQGQSAAYGIWQSGRGREYLFSVGQAYWKSRIERELRSRRAGRGDPPVPYPVAAEILTGAATALLNWWIKKKMPHSPEEMQEMFDRMMLPGIREILV